MKNAPELWTGNEFYYRAFLRLHTGRRVGFSEAAISWADIEEYGLRFGLDEAEREDLEEVITRVDKEYLDWRKDDNKRKQSEERMRREAEQKAKGRK